jgi:hypothetical protein
MGLMVVLNMTRGTLQAKWRVHILQKAVSSQPGSAPADCGDAVRGGRASEHGR